MLTELITQHALVDAQAGKWDAVAATLNTLRKTVTVGRVGGKASLGALVANGIDPGKVITAMRADPMASELLNTLNASGVDWADDLTAFVMGKLVASGAIPQQTAELMRSLSVRSEPVVSTTAEECSAAWEYAKINTAFLTARNESLNQALATGDRVALIAGLRELLALLEAG